MECFILDPVAVFLEVLNITTHPWIERLKDFVVFKDLFGIS